MALSPTEAVTATPSAVVSPGGHGIMKCREFIQRSALLVFLRTTMYLNAGHRMVESRNVNILWKVM